MTTSDDQTVRDQTVALIQAYQTLLAERRFDEWIELWADDGVCEFPYAAPGRPSRLCGKDAILSYVIVAETKDARLTHYREYWNPLITAEAFA